ncbi:tRNA-specific adenosine deaminase [Rickettsiales bacterium Ac37b]|nr:tRNA-specific adenosine deaminase [Rickettsiales bacterium Ac37b]
MEFALKEAELASMRGEVPIGAVIVNSLTNEIITTSSNEVEKLQDPTAHAELLAIKKACSLLGSKFINYCDLYVTLEPCPMCAHAISLARIRRLYFGAYDIKGGGVQHGARVFSSNSCHHTPEIYEGIEALKSETLLKNFFQKLR